MNCYKIIFAFQDFETGKTNEFQEYSFQAMIDSNALRDAAILETDLDKNGKTVYIFSKNLKFISLLEHKYELERCKKHKMEDLGFVQGNSELFKELKNQD